MVVGRVDGWIDVPGVGVLLDPRELWVEGWAYSRTSPVAHVDVYLDDYLLGRATLSRSRPDVAGALCEPQAALSGFDLHVTKAPVPADGHGSLRAVVTVVDGTQGNLAPVAVRFSPVIGCIDVPGPSAVLDLWGLRVSGWAYGWTSPVSRVDVFLDGHRLGRAGLGRPRPDVAGALCEPQAALSGFDLHVTKAPVPADGHGSLRAVVTVVDGTQGNLAPVAVQFRPMSETPPSDVPIPRLAGPLHLGRRRSGDVIRVLWSARGFDQGGSQLRMAELVERLSYDGGFHSTVLSPTEGPLRSVLEAAGATVHVGLGVPLDDAAEYERSLSHLAEWMDGRFDLVVGFAVTSFPAVDVASRVGVPSVLRIGEAEPLPTVVAWLFGPLNPDVERQARRAVTGASVVLSNSHAAVENYRAHGYAGRFVVLATGVDVAGARAYRDANDREECRRRLAVRPDERFLLCAASLWTVKGQAVLVTALDLVHREHPHLTCALVGHAVDGYVGAISSFVARTGLTDVVRVLPFHDDLRPWWFAADVAVCPSESEALPAAVLEAMAHGLPVLSCRVGDLPHLVEPGVTGWLCDHSDLGAMIAGLEAVATASPEQLRRMGAAAEQTVARSYDRTEVLDRTTELLRSVADGAMPDWVEGQTDGIGPVQPA